MGSIPSQFGPAFAKVFGLAVMGAGIIFVLMFLVGGIQYLTSAGNEEASTKAKKLLVDAVIGIVIVFIAFAAGTFILEKLGIPFTLIGGTPTLTP